ncbi:RNA methyltransferase [Azonexus sp. R2A61]|uniref:TrmH family RNA methyltransferase n=1 Tax=Azonexus sp. R2A61 TaxID=2744443 RepID=UPI001F403B82|nr:RNA methyltransferase [Azonexus sp. R2A61]
MKPIQSRDNPFYKQLKKLASSGRERRKAGQTVLDGLHLLKAWEAARGLVDTPVVSESAIKGGEIADYLAGRHGIVLTDPLMRELGLVDTPSGVLAVVTTPSSPLAVDGRIDSILLDGVQDPGNVGTLLRTAAAAGVRQALLGPGCASAWSPRVLRAGQGAHFVLDVHEDVDLPAFVQNYAGTVAVTCLDGAVSLYDAVWSTPLAWVFGAEGQGVRRELIDLADLKVRIPMSGAVESLNVSAAAAVCLFEAVRRKT